MNLQSVAKALLIVGALLALFNLIKKLLPGQSKGKGAGGGAGMALDMGAAMGMLTEAKSMLNSPEGKRMLGEVSKHVKGLGEDMEKWTKLMPDGLAKDLMGKAAGFMKKNLGPEDLSKGIAGLMSKSPEVPAPKPTPVERQEDKRENSTEARNLGAATGRSESRAPSPEPPTPSSLSR